MVRESRGAPYHQRRDRDQPSSRVHLIPYHISPPDPCKGFFPHGDSIQNPSATVNLFERTLPMKMKPLALLPPLAMLSLLSAPPAQLFASSHREAPITALDPKADITDWYAFVSPEHPDHVVMILNVDPFLEPSNGPNYFPFDPNILYEMKVDNDHDGKEDVTFQFGFTTQIRQPGVFTGFVGNLAGIPAITALDGAGSEGLSLRQTYTVTMVTKHGYQQIAQGQTLFAVP